jgi:hypothetical protein
MGSRANYIRTLNYSWHTANTLECCEFIESELD